LERDQRNQREPEGEKLAGSLITEVSNPDLVLLALTRQKLCPTIILAIILQQIPG
jgi:hypothetical protein